MEIKYWLDKWTVGETAFHQTQFEAKLLQYFSEFKPGTVLVPLCGKTLDMIWLAKNKWKVIGIEASETACRAFFTENEIAHDEKTVADFKVFKSQNAEFDISIWCGDFFAFDSGQVDKISAVYDRAAMIALPPDFRPRYAEKIKSILTQSGTNKIEMLLLAIEYQQDQVKGPPFSVDQGEIRSLYEKFFYLRQLRRDTIRYLSGHTKFVGTEVVQTVYLLEKK